MVPNHWCVENVYSPADRQCFLEVFAVWNGLQRSSTKNLLVIALVACLSANTRQLVLVQLDETGNREGLPSKRALLLLWRFIKLLTVSRQLGESLASACRKCCYFHSNYDDNDVLATEPITRRFLFTGWGKHITYQLVIFPQPLQSTCQLNV